MGVEVNTHELEHCGGEVLRRDRSFLDAVAACVGRTDDLTVFQATARDEHRHAVGPMIATGGLRHHGAATEFAEHEDEGRVEQSARFEIGHERVYDSIDGRQQRFQPLLNAALFDFIAVMIEVAPRAADYDVRDARFDQSPREQSLLTDRVAPIGVAELR